MRKLGIVCIVLLVVVSCQRPLYKYQNYDEATYKYATAYDEKDVKRASRSLKNVVDGTKKSSKSKKEKKNTVPPGVCVDYACLLLKQQDTVKALQYLEREVRLYPESKTYVNTLKKSLGL